MKRQYIGRLGKIDNGIVAVTLVAVADEVVLPLTFDVFKPKDRLKEGEPHESKPEIAVRLLGELIPLGLNIAHVSADCGYGNASCFVSALERWHLPYLVSVPSDYGFWRLPGQRLRSTRWRRTNDATML